MKLKSLNKTVSLRTFLFTVGLILVLSLGTIRYIAAQTPQYVVSPFGFVKTASYIIRKAGNIYYAIDGTYGTILQSGSDAATVIQAAINIIGLSGGIIHLMTGGYALSTYLDLSGTKDITLRGEGTQGQSLTYLAANVNFGENYVIFKNETYENRNARAFKLENLRIYVNPTQISPVGSLYVKNTNRWKITNCHMQSRAGGATSYVVRLSATELFWIENSEISGDGTMDSYGIYGQEVRAANIIGNYINANTTSIHIRGASSSNIIQSNRLADGGEAIRLFSIHSSGDYLENIICYNTIYDLYNNGITLDHANWTLVFGNTIKNVGQGIGTAYGIKIVDSYFLKISVTKVLDNQESPTTDWGVYESSGDNNTITDVDTIGCSIGGIYSTGPNTHVNLCWNGTTWIP